MTWSYGNEPTVYPDGTYNLDLVRFLLGDTDATNQLLSNEELAFFISEESSPYIAAARAAESLVGRYTKLTQYSIGDFSTSANQLVQQYTDLAGLLRDRAYRKITIFAGGIDPVAEQKDHARKFGRNMHVDRTY